MTFKEMTAGIQLISGALAIGWLVLDAQNGGLAGATIASVAVKLLWVIGAMIVFNIVATIVGTIVVSIIQGEPLKDEKRDERDDAVSARSQRNASIATSILAALALFPLAMGADGVFAVHALFAAPLAGGLVNAAFQLVYYRIG